MTKTAPRPGFQLFACHLQTNSSPSDLQLLQRSKSARQKSAPHRLARRTGRHFAGSRFGAISPSAFVACLASIPSIETPAAARAAVALPTTRRRSIGLEPERATTYDTVVPWLRRSPPLAQSRSVRQPLASPSPVPEGEKLSLGRIRSPLEAGRARRGTLSRGVAATGMPARGASSFGQHVRQIVSDRNLR